VTRDLLAFPRLVGGAVVDTFGYAERIASVVGGAGLMLAGRGMRMRPAVRSVYRAQVYFTGVQAIPFASLLAGLVAMVVVVQARLAGAAAEGGPLGRLLVVVVVRELGPLAVATVVVARTCSAIAAELGAMRVSGEVDGLTGMGIDPFEYLVLPRLLGVSVAVFCLGILFATLSVLFGAALTSALSTNVSAGDVLDIVGTNLKPLDYLVVIAKTWVPGTLMAAISCLEGLSASRSSTAVPPAVSRAVVRSMTAVFLWDGLVTALAYAL
jgi:phospholipid/cholesterol/gamma-HCH transport system permease protein